MSGPYDRETVIAVIVALARVESVIGSKERETTIRTMYAELITDFGAGEMAAVEFVGAVAHYANTLHARTYGTTKDRPN